MIVKEIKTKLLEIVSTGTELYAIFDSIIENAQKNVYEQKDNLIIINFRDKENKKI